MASSSDSDTEDEEKSTVSSRGSADDDDEAENDKQEAAEDDDDDNDDADDDETDSEDNDDDDEGEEVEEAQSKSKKKSTPKKTTPKKATNGSAKKGAAGSSTPNSDSTPKSKGTPRVRPAVSIAQMVHDSIVALKDRTGSSQIAIQKYMLATYPELTAAKLKSRLLLSLKAGLTSKRFIKNRASYKIHPDFKAKQQNQKRRVAKQAAAKKKKVADEKAKVKKQQEAPKLTPAQIAAQKEKDRQEAIRKARAERIKRRKFPMEDLALIKEDKELGVTVSLPSRPTLPLVFSSLLPAATSKSDTTGAGLWEDVIHVYHFFRGDVGWGQQMESDKQLYVVAPFSLRQWIHAVEQIVCGNSKQSRMLPPLVSHLFCVALQHLCRNVPKLLVGLSPSSWSDILSLYMDAMERYATTDASLVALEGRGVLKGVPIDAAYLLGATDTPKMVTGQDEEEEKVLPLYLAGDSISKAYDKLSTHDPWMLSAEELMTLLRCLVDDMMGGVANMQEAMDSRLTESYELSKKKRATDALVRKLQTTLKAKQDASTKPEKKTDSKSDDTKNGGNNEGGGHDKNSEDAPPGESGGTSKTAKPKKAAPVLSSKSIAALTKELEAAKKVQQRVTSDFERAGRSGRIRTEPIGFDRNFNAVYHFPNDPECVYIRQRVGLAKPNLWEVPMEFRTYKTVWHFIDKKSVFDTYLESLDVRGKREAALHEAMQPLRRHLFDDIKVKSAQNAALREKEDLQRRLENAKLKCEAGRRSGRLAGKAEEEFIVLQAEIDGLQKSLRGEAKPKPVDWEDITGLELLRRFDRCDIFQPCNQDATAPLQQPKRKATTRRDAQKLQQIEEEQVNAASDEGPPLEKINCSSLWPSEDGSGDGGIGLFVSSLLGVERRCQALSEWDLGDDHRSAWISNLRSSVTAWQAASLPIIAAHVDVSPDEVDDSEDDAKGNPSTKRKSVSSSSDSGKKRRVDGVTSGSVARSSSPSNGQSASSLSVSQLLSKLRQPLLQLEHRIFEVSGLARAARDIQEADENMSTIEENEELKQEQLQSAWKKILHRLNRLSAKFHAKIRAIVVEAIAAARKAHLGEVVGQLRSALLVFHPEAAGQCKAAALKVLEEHGGYHDIDDDEEDEDVDEDKEPQEEANKEQPEAGISTVLCAEAGSLNSSLEGQDRADWIAAVKSAKTISKFASLAVAFAKKASTALNKLESEREALSNFMDALQKAASKKRKSAGSEPTEPAEIWTNVDVTDEFCFAKIVGWPWWPAKKCHAKDVELTASLETLGLTLVSLLGDSGDLRVVKTAESLMPFSETHPTEDLSAISRTRRNALDDAMAMARRLIRSKEKKPANKKRKSTQPPAKKSSDSDCKDEKKVAT